MQEKPKLPYTHTVDLLGELKLYIERALLVSGNIGENYFYQFDPDKKDEKQGILLEFERNRILNDIVFDYLVKMRCLIEPYQLTESEEPANVTNPL